MKNDEKETILNEFAEKLIQSQTDLEPEFQAAANEVFDQLFYDVTDDPLLAHSHKDNPLTLEQMNQIHLNDTRLLWHSNFWDGPLSGMMLWDGEPRYYKDYDEKFISIPWTQQEIDEYIAEYGGDEEEEYCEYEHHRWYKVYKLTKEELDHEFGEHELFRKYVGTHCDYDEEQKRNHYGVKKRWWHKFFYKYQKKRNKDHQLRLTEDKVVGYFKLY